MNKTIFPLVIILTHRQGVGLCLLKNENEVNPIQFLILGKTAENLSDAYLGLLKLGKLNPAHVKTLAVGTGPGSFTGLRLGCAFANGIKIGQDCNLLSFPTELASYFLNQFSFSSEEEFEQFKQELGEYIIGDESSGRITSLDIQDAIEKVKSNSTRVDNLEPHYGREPGPVLKLKGTLNGS